MMDSMFYDDDDGRICHQCGGSVGKDGYTNDVGEYYFCSFECFSNYMNETYGEGNWRECKDENEAGGFYEYFENGEWHPDDTFWTEWEDE